VQLPFPRQRSRSEDGRPRDRDEESGGRRIDHAVAEVRRWAERTTITGELAIVRWLLFGVHSGDDDVVARLDPIFLVA